MTVDVFEQTRIKLQRAKTEYQHALTQIDGDLRRIVSRDPVHLEAARDIQASYIDDIHPVELAAAEQPAEAKRPGPKKTNVTKKKATKKK